MNIDEALEVLDERVDDPEIASEITKLLGLFEIQYQKVERERKSREIGTAEGWKQARAELNKLAKREFKGVKVFTK